MAELRWGFTTGTCAAAAAKAAALCLRENSSCNSVPLVLPDGSAVTLSVAGCLRTSDTSARAWVIKDAGDDPDVTHGATIVVDLECLSPAGATLVFCAGEGVGTVTRAGLQIPPGEPAINPVPRMQIAQAVREILGDEGSFRLTVSVPGGQELALRTFNPRLGVVGGISILGTTGRVKPKSAHAWLQSLLPQLDVALAAGRRELVFVPGNHGEEAARTILAAPADAIVHVSNFVGDMLKAAAERGAEKITLIGHAGKLIKVAAGVFNTHSSAGDARLETVAAMAAAAGASPLLVREILSLPTVEACIPLLEKQGFSHAWDAVAARAAERAGLHCGLPVRCILTGFGNVMLADSAAPRRLFWPQGISYAVVGVGPAGTEWMTPVAWRFVQAADVLAGGRRQLEPFAPLTKETIVLGADLNGFAADLARCRGRRVAVLASGDPSCFGILAALQRRFPGEPLHVVPGISSMQLAMARLGIPSWADVRFHSAHGRPLDDCLSALTDCSRALVLTDSVSPPHTVALRLHENGFRGRVAVCENLGYPEERVTSGSPSEIAVQVFSPLSVVFVEKEPCGD